MQDHSDIAISSFELVSGLEIHVQLNTRSKIFAPDSTAFGGAPNTHVSPVSVALPGALPYLNKEVITKAIRMGLALNCTVQQQSYFDRKNYFYADLPKGYQITQDAVPICVNGFLDVTLSDGRQHRIRINRIHLEEDAGKSLHDQNPSYSYVDLNRAGVPLIEIVTEPDIRSAEEAAALLTEIRQLVRHLEVSDGNMEEGSLRCDANISIRRAGDKGFHTRCEIKNLNSIRHVKKAMEIEFNRQVALVKAGESVIQSTLNFDVDRGLTIPMRSKEEANDYRYFPDPDLQPLQVSDEWLQEIQRNMPALPQDQILQLMKTLGIGQTEAAVIVQDQAIYAYLQAALPAIKIKKSLVYWLNGSVRAWLNEQNKSIDQFPVQPLQLAAIINLVEDKKISQQSAWQQLIPALKEDTDVNLLAAKLEILIDEEDDAYAAWIDEVLRKYPEQVSAYRKGKKGVLGLFVGEVMKLAKGKADARKLNEEILKRINGH